MSVVVYGQDRQWEIPAFVWPAVLGLSVGLHIAVLLYGLPSQPWQPDEPTVPPETELIIDSGGLPFENLLAVEAEPAAEMVPDEAQLVSPVDPVTPLSAPTEATVVEPVAELPLQPVENSEVASTSGEVQTLEDVAPSLPSAVDAVEIAEVEAETVAPAPPSGSVVEVAESTPSDPATIYAVQTVQQSPVEEMVPVASVAPAEETFVAAVPSAPDITANPEAVVPLAASDATLVEVPAPEEVAASETVASPVPPDAILSLDPQIVEAAPATTFQPTEPVTAGETAITPVTPVAPAESNLPPAIPQNVTPSETLQSQPADVITPTQSEAVAPVATAELPAVAPAEQQIAAVQPSETPLQEIVPSAPEASAVPATPPSEPAENVPPVDVASIDPLASVTSFVENYDIGDCAHLSVLSAGADTANVAGYAVNPAPFVLFDQRFTAEQGYEASISLNIVSRDQCALLNTLGLAGGIEAADLVSLKNTVVKSGTQVSGVIQRDLPLERIAAAEQSGLDLSGKGPPELYLIDNDGQIHDGRGYLLPASNPKTAGGWRFVVPVTLLSGGDEELALVLAIWNRPAARQPARFGTLPSSRIAAVLAEPGVYSLTAFKVSR